MSKGFTLSLDSAFAVVVLVIFLASFSFLSIQAVDDPYPLLLLQKQANDMLAVMDKSGELSTLNETLMNESLNATLPTYVLRDVEIEYYNYSSAGFVYAGNLTFGDNYTGTEESAVVQREFVVFENSSAKYYGIARLRLWVE